MKRMDRSLLIVFLITVLGIMAVAFAAFSTQLTINGSANITSTWNVGFDTTKTSGTGVVSTAGTATGGTISYTDAQHASISSTGLVKPGDSATYTLTIKNTGSIAATLGTPTISGTSCTVNGLMCTSASGNIKFTVTAPANSSLAASTGSTTMTVKAEYVNRTVTYATTETASITVSLNATQA